MIIWEGLPVHEYSGPPPHEGESTLRIDGLVRRAMHVCAADLDALLRIEHVEAFACEEGWIVPAVRWRGMRLTDVVALAGPLPSSRFIRVHAGDYVVPISISAAASALLCGELNGQPLSPAHGAPWRLLIPGAACFTSVKWVDRLEVTAAPGENVGEHLARARLATVRGV